MSEIIFGRNPVKEALKNNSPIQKIYLIKDSSVGEIINLARERKIPLQETDKRNLDKLAGGEKHQGVVAVAAAKDYVEVDDILRVAAERGEPPFILILDEIEDPHNLGAVLRTADATGVHGVIIPKHRAVGLTGVVAKTSAGAIEYVPVARVTNLANTIETLKKAGCWVTGLDADGEKLYSESDLKGPVALVVGSEGKGIGRLIKEKCDFLVKLPMLGKVSSLNAGVAAALMMYEVVRQRRNLQ